jgi:alkylated DNA repair dioxygenase AlkB
MQRSFFEDELTELPIGMRFMPQFLSLAEEGALLALLGGLPLREAQYKAYTARRRVIGFGGQFDYDANELKPGAPIPDALKPLRERVAAWLALEPECFSQMLVAEYRPGTPLGWHRDVPDFESIVGLSLLGEATMRFWPYPHVPGRASKAFELQLPPRSAYVLEGDARWGWQHSIVATKALRYSITLRTRRGSHTPSAHPPGNRSSPAPGGSR